MTPCRLSNIRALILDMDGVLWKDDQSIGHLPTIFDRINSNHLRVVLATNNSTRDIDMYQAKVRSFGVELESWQLVNSSQATARYLQHRFPHGGPVFILGEEPLVKTLREAGFYLSEDKILAVVAGMDRAITYDKLRIASMLIRTGIPFIGTNPDRTFPTPAGLVPGTGAILAALQAASDVEPVIAGKPSPEMYQIAMERLHTEPEETLVVGDRPETDIVGGQALGCPTALVLSGVVTLEKAKAWQPTPDLIAEDLSAVLDTILLNSNG